VSVSRSLYSVRKINALVSLTNTFERVSFYANAVGRTRGGYADHRQDLSSHTCHQLTRQNVPESY